MVTHITHRPEETIALGETWGRTASAGLVIGLTGDLGAGKTQLVKGIARGLGLTARITSPSFALVNEHRGGRLPLYHLDLYRLDTPEQIVTAGVDHYLFEPDGLIVVEWIERWLGEGKSQSVDERNLPQHYRQVVIETIGETTRKIRYEDFGA